MIINNSINIIKNKNSELINFIEGLINTELIIVKQTKNTFEAKAICFSHNDHTPSLGISWLDDGGVVFNCFACGVKGNLKGLANQFNKLTEYEAFIKKRKWLNLNQTNDNDNDLTNHFYKPYTESGDVVKGIISKNVFKDEANALCYLTQDHYNQFKEIKFIHLLFNNDDFINQYLINQINDYKHNSYLDTPLSIKKGIQQEQKATEFAKNWLWISLKANNSKVINQLKVLNLIASDINKDGMLYQQIGYAKPFDSNSWAFDDSQFEANEIDLQGNLTKQNKGYLLKYKAINTLFGDNLVRFDKCYQKRLIIPIKDILGNFVSYIGVNAFSKKAKYLFKRGFNKRFYFYSIITLINFNHKKPLYICEGVRDVWSLHKMGYQAVALLGCNISEYQIKVIDWLMRNGGVVVIAMDDDDVGLNATNKIKQKLKNGLTCKYIKILIIDKKQMYKGNKDIGALLNKQDKRSELINNGE